MISMKDYAEQKHISYEAVRKQVARYRNELEGHIFKRDRTQFLDDYAIDFLEQKRATNPVVIYEVAKDEEIDRLKKENDSYLKKIASLQEQLLLQKEQMVALEAAQRVAEKEKQLAVSETLLEANKKAEEAQKKAVEQAVEKEKEKAEIEKSKAVAAAEEAKDNEFAPIRKELEDELEAERHRKLTLSERLFGRKK